MNKDILVLLLQRDIKELSLLTEGFEKMNELPDALVRLAVEKGENILQALKQLENQSQPELGAIDYEEFGEAADAENDFDGDEKNNFDAPLDSALETPVNPNDILEEEATPILSETKTGETEDEISYIATEPDEMELADKDVFVSGEFAGEGIEAEIEPEPEPEQILTDEDFSDEDDLEIDYELAVSEAILPDDEEETLELAQPTVNKPVVNQINETLNDKLTADNSVSANLANQKVEDIRLAINIGDRFRFQRELFGGNGEVLNKTISYLNQLAKFSEAEAFLKSKFGWDEENVHAEDFLNIVKRRYL